MLHVSRAHVVIENCRASMYWALFAAHYISLQITGREKDGLQSTLKTKQKRCYLRKWRSQLDALITCANVRWRVTSLHLLSSSTLLSYILDRVTTYSPSVIRAQRCECLCPHHGYYLIQLPRWNFYRSDTRGTHAVVAKCGAVYTMRSFASLRAYFHRLCLAFVYVVLALRATATLRSCSYVSNARYCATSAAFVASRYPLSHQVGSIYTCNSYTHPRNLRVRPGHVIQYYILNIATSITSRVSIRRLVVPRMISPQSAQQKPSPLDRIDSSVLTPRL